jgi:hypothetical protein
VSSFDELWEEYEGVYRELPGKSATDGILVVTGLAAGSAAPSITSLTGGCEVHGGSWHGLSPARYDYSAAVTCLDERRSIPTEPHIGWITGLGTEKERLIYSIQKQDLYISQIYIHEIRIPEASMVVVSPAVSLVTVPLPVFWPLTSESTGYR